MKPKITNIILLVVVGMLAGVALKLYLSCREKSEDDYRASVLAVEKINAEQRAMINAGKSQAQLEQGVQEAVAEQRAQESGLAAQLKKQEATARVYDIAARDALAERQRAEAAALTNAFLRAQLIQALQSAK